jgi:hypothetical protein
MKKLLTVLAAVALFAVALVPDTSAQIGASSPSGSVPRSFVLTNTALLIPGNTTSNLPTFLQVILPSPARGFGVFTQTGATNSVDTTNAVFRFVGVCYDSSGRTQEVAQAAFLVSAPLNGTGTGLGYTNAFPFIERNLLGVDGIRLKSIQNTNANSIWVTNVSERYLP